MKRTTLFHKFAFAAALILMTVAVPCRSQSVSGSPKQEKLLNGLKVLMWPDVKADKARVRLRLHSGSAFDPIGKEGVMKMLSQALFPSEASREFFVEDLEGSLDVVTTYDYIEINASSKPDALMTMLETIATAVANPSIDKENTARLQSVTLERLKKYSADPIYVADHAVAFRMFGQHPYGRPIDGSTSSVEKLVFADLLDAQQRFLTADNATLAIAGNFNREQAYKGVRRLFGSWIKADRKVPSTFRQPDAPDVSIVTVTSPQPTISGYRVAVRGVARGDKDLAAAQVLTAVLRSRMQKTLPPALANAVIVRNEAHTLPGSIVLGAATADDVPNSPETKDLFRRLLMDQVTDAEFRSAKQMIAADWGSRDLMTAWLDQDTYKLASTDIELRQLESLSLNGVQAYAERLKGMPSATIVLTANASK